MFFLIIYNTKQNESVCQPAYLSGPINQELHSYFKCELQINEELENTVMAPFVRENSGQKRKVFKFITKFDL